MLTKLRALGIPKAIAETFPLTPIEKTRRWCNRTPRQAETASSRLAAFRSTLPLTSAITSRRPPKGAYTRGESAAVQVDS
jgi:hypothetical protein